MRSQEMSISKRSRPDIAPIILVLLGRVRATNINNWCKLKKLCEYFHSTVEDHLVVSIYLGVNIALSVHEEFWSYTSGISTMLKSSCDLIMLNTKMKVNSSSSTEVELIAVDDILVQCFGCQNSCWNRGN